MRLAAHTVRRAAGALAALVAPLSDGRAQCSVCQAAMAGAENGGQLIGGFQQGIALMFVVMGVLGVLGWRIIRRARSEFAIRQSALKQSRFSNNAAAMNSCLPAENPASR